MCGIFGYIGKKSASDECLTGLKLLEYRGYDSSGIAGILNNKIHLFKKKGKVAILESLLEQASPGFTCSIAHTRWATHGIPSHLNAHPHIDNDKSIAVVHNGIIENHTEIRKILTKKGVRCQSDTDSEVIAQLFSINYNGDLVATLTETIKQLHGTFALAIIHKDHPDTIVATASENPLVIGYNEEEIYLSSDLNSFSGKTLNIVYLQDKEIACLEGNTARFFDKNGNPLSKPSENITLDEELISKNGYEHFMLKEIFEQSITIQNCLAGRLSEEFGTAFFDDLTLPLTSTNRIVLLACGTSYHAASLAVMLLENIARIPAEAHIASEFRYTNPIISKNTLVIAISQSGETADTIAAVREAKIKGAKVLSFCNVPRSTLARVSDDLIRLQAGPEISVCSTKAFTSQITLLALFSLYLARLKHLSKEEGIEFVKELKVLPHKVNQVLNQAENIKKYAEKYASFEHFFFLGRSYMFPTSLEAALKLKEISYANATGYAAGEMKHGPIALINPELAVIGMCGNELTFEKTVSNLTEIYSRGSPILVFAPEKYLESIQTVTNEVIFIPETIDELSPTLYSVAGQLFAYYIALSRGTEIDKPRNLAKSVTVE